MGQSLHTSCDVLCCAVPSYEGDVCCAVRTGIVDSFGADVFEVFMGLSSNLPTQCLCLLLTVANWSKKRSNLLLHMVPL